MRIGDRDMLIAGHAGRSVIPWLPIMCVNSPVWKDFYMKTGNKWVLAIHSNQAHLMKSIKQLEDGKGTVHELTEADDE